LKGRVGGRARCPAPRSRSSYRRADKAVDPNLTHPFALPARPVEDDEQVVHAVPVRVHPSLRDRARIELASLPILPGSGRLPDAPPHNRTRLRRRDSGANLGERVAGIRATDKLQIRHSSLSKLRLPFAWTTRPLAPDTPRGAGRGGGAPCGGPMREL